MWQPGAKYEFSITTTLVYKIMLSEIQVASSGV